MSVPIPEGLGPCGICHRKISQTSEVTSVMRGFPPRAYMAHKECKKRLEDEAGGPLKQVTQSDYLKLAPEVQAKPREGFGIVAGQEFEPLNLHDYEVVDESSENPQVAPEDPSSEESTKETDFQDELDKGVEVARQTAETIRQMAAADSDTGVPPIKDTKPVKKATQKKETPPNA